MAAIAHTPEGGYRGPMPAPRHLERIVRCAGPVVVTSAGVTHDAGADGTIEHGVGSERSGS